MEEHYPHPPASLSVVTVAHNSAPAVETLAGCRSTCANAHAERTSPSSMSTCGNFSGGGDTWVAVDLAGIAASGARWCCGSSTSTSTARERAQVEDADARMASLPSRSSAAPLGYAHPFTEASPSHV